ncbi:MAG: hypothetical protein J6X44_10290, partial [Thermoguttaceae bacterium]|nr:hypothetical protein [Thermoguttaceae bacterium]
MDGALELALACVDCSFDDASHNVLKEVENAFAALMSIDSNKGDEKIVEAMERYLASDDETLVQAGLRLGYLRKCEGAKPNLEGVCVDGSVFDWSAYRGKSTILVLCDSNSFLSPNFKASYELLKRFAENDSANILTYAAD